MQDVVRVFHIAAVHDLIGHEVPIKSREHDADRDAGDKQPEQFSLHSTGTGSVQHFLHTTQSRPCGYFRQIGLYGAARQWF